MGYWGGNNDDSANELIEKQMADNNRAIEEQRQELAQRRLDIIKTQGAPNWSPTPPPEPSKGFLAREKITQLENDMFKRSK